MFSRELALRASGWAYCCAEYYLVWDMQYFVGGGKNPVFCYICALNLNHKE